MRLLPLLALLITGCGGSSSETPPPLEPDPTSFRYTGPRVSAVEEDKAPAADPEVDEDDLPVKPKQAAATTWGSGRPARSATPAPALAPSARVAPSAPAAPPVSAAPSAPAAPPASASPVTSAAPAPAPAPAKK